MVDETPLTAGKMNLAADSLFASHSDPMWIYEVGTLRFLAVNHSAIAKYGYSEDEFLAMTIADIRPSEDREALAEYVGTMTDGRDEAGVWRHCLKSGAVIHVDITGHRIEHEGRQAELIAARDVSRIVCAERTAREALMREKAARESSDILARQLQIIFDSVPGVFLVLSPDKFDIIAVSEAYLRKLDLKRVDIVGRNLFECFPSRPDDPTQAHLRDSLLRVTANMRPDLLDVQKFFLPAADPLSVGVECYWALSNTPIASSDGRLLYIMLRIQDVTDAIRSEGIRSLGTMGIARALAASDLVAHTLELKADNNRLTELAAQLRTTQRLLDTGTWEYAIDEDRLHWSANIYRMFGVTSDTFGHRFKDYAGLVPIEDREEVVAGLDAFLAGKQTQFQFAHKVIHSDGRIVHIRGLLEKVESATGPMLSGVVQNVTESVKAANELARVKRLLEIAGTSAKFGAWQYDVDADRLEWSAQTARIYDEVEGFSPSLTQQISYFADKHQDKIKGLFKACISRGDGFDEIVEIIGAKGRKLWVRTTGEAARDETGRIIAVNGAIQDITELTIVRKRAEASEKLLEIAGRAVRLGGWSVSLVDQKVFWTDGVADIHGVPRGTSPTFEGGINYFAPEDREAAKQVFDACAKDGIPFDDVRDLITANGNRLKVRSLGEPVRDKAGKIVGVQGAFQDISELHAARRHAGEMSQKVIRTFESIRDGVLTLDGEWRFSLVNAEATRILSMHRDQLLGQVIWDVFPMVEASDIGINYKRARATGETQRFVAYSKDMDRWYDVAVFPSGEEISIFFRDVTDLRQEQEHLRLLVTAVARQNDIVIITEAGRNDGPDDPKIVFVNDAFERRTGYSRQEAIGQSPRILQGPKTKGSELERIRIALDNWQPVRAELINYTKSGQEFWVEIDIVPVTNDVGSITHWVAIERDITDRRQAEAELRLSDKRFRMIARATGNAVWEWNVAGAQEWWSDGLTDTFGHLPDAEGQMLTAWRANVHPDDKVRVVDAWGRLLAGQIDTMLERYQFRRADGTWAHVEDRAFAIRDDEGHAVRLLGSMTDISERQSLEDRLRQSQKLEAVGQLTGGIAHDFNNLLTIIMGNTELLLEKLGDTDPLRRYADMSAIAAERGAELINRLLSFSRKQALSPRLTNVSVVISGIEQMLRRTLGEDIAIKIGQSENVWETELDQGQLEAALLNLANNSRDAMPDGGALTIDTENVAFDLAGVSAELGIPQGQFVVISVRDTGHGIEHDQINRVFEPFYTTKAVGKGTGLGLSMVYGFVKQTGGHIRINSEPNKGTLVKLFFPRFAGQTLADVPDTESNLSVQGNETILVVEDDPLILTQLTEQLSALGYLVVAAQQGEPALSILRERSDVNLLLTDIILPGGMNGRQIADAAQKIRPSLKILFTSGYSENAIIHHERLEPGVELLSKPYRRSELASKIRSVLKG